ncbi:hypothetical protein GCM10009541_59170 [Micromonospora gifhornensis]|uniref:Uncharacterized protein n=1 Tax=Micromonospora gifhornensis TaxID=84594 RepID=A0ABQ4IMN2_9ACTN|nr:hypothetical protein [Micromonospora gifhornensis]GIJ19169.1 hypothetical protein Vgi01_58530 [Micromonospora gifhornensis]
MLAAQLPWPYASWPLRSASASASSRIAAAYPAMDQCTRLLERMIGTLGAKYIVVLTM